MPLTPSTRSRSSRSFTGVTSPPRSWRHRSAPHPRHPTQPATEAPMDTSTLLSPTVQAAPAPGTDAPAARFLIGWAATLLPLLAAMVALGLGWLLLDASTWPAAAAGVIGWALAA